jgi:hypothetical protein
MPGEQDAARHDPVQPQVPEQQPRQGAITGPVSPVRLRAGDLTAQDRNFMPRHQDLQVSGDVAACEQSQPAEQPDHEQIDEVKEHECRR